MADKSDTPADEGSASNVELTEVTVDKAAPAESKVSPEEQQQQQQQQPEKEEEEGEEQQQQQQQQSSDGPPAVALPKKNQDDHHSGRKTKTPRHFTRRRKDQMFLEWNDIKFSVKERGKVKEILKGVNGTAGSGEMLALMGPSGAGKSSLLNILACRTQSTRSGSMSVTGTIKCNGKEVERDEFRKEVAYVMQDDVMYAYQTPREVLRFSAKLRLPADRSVEERKELVDWMLSTLGLEACADTRIGSIKVTGISGGERKRTAIGVELITAPSILFLDEPTSGLDSYAAYNVVKVLTELSNQGTTVIATIHQPSSETFGLFRKTYLIAKGCTVFNSETSAMISYFADLGHECPPQYNPADFVMFLMQKCNEAELLELVDAWKKRRASNPLPTYEEVKRDALAIVPTSFKDEGDDQALVSSDGPAPNCCVQLGWLSQRSFVNFARDYPSLIARLAITVFQNLVVALVFFGIGREYSDITPANSTVPGDEARVSAELGQAISAHFGILFFVCIGALFGLAQPLLLNFPTERPVFLREHAVGTYSAFPYFLSAMFVEIPIGVIQMLLVYIVTYWVVGLAGNFIYLVLVTSLLGFVSASTAILIGALTSTVETALQSAPLTFVPQILFAGFFIPIALIPVWLRWAQFLCALKYGINLILLIEFAEPPPSFLESGVDVSVYYRAIYGCETATTSCENQLAAAMYPQNEIEIDGGGIYVGIMFGIFVLFRTIAALVLAARSRSTT